MSITGVWMWPQSVRIYGAPRIAALCAQSGITDIYFLTKGLAGTTSYLGQIAPADCGRDLLQELIESAHASGIRVHAWLTSASDEAYKQQHPESGRCHYTRGRDRGLISLRDKPYLAYMERIVCELCSRYAIDGLHLDYIRYNHLLYGWSEEDQALYAAHGADLQRLRSLMDSTFPHDGSEGNGCIFDAYRAGDESALALAHTRRQDVCAFATSLTQCARAENNSLILSAALMPEGAYDDTAFADLHYGQSYEDAASLYDYALPMAYSKAYEKDGAWVRTVAEGTRKHGLQTVMGLHAYDGGTGPSLADDIRALSNADISGICLFRFGAYATVLPDGGSLRIINTLSHPITSIQSDDGKLLLNPGKTIEPGCEETLPLAACASPLRVFCGQTEACVYIATPTTIAK